MLIKYHDTLTTVINATIEKPGERKNPKNISFLVVVKEDIQNNRTPIHVNVEAKIAKGKYHDYDIFLSSEAAQFLKLCLGHRWKGTMKMPPENITDNLPLIREQTTRTPKSISQKQMRKLIQQLYKQAELENHQLTLLSNQLKQLIQQAATSKTG